jgi:hypothetical protein
LKSDRHASTSRSSCDGIHETSTCNCSWFGSTHVSSNSLARSTIHAMNTRVARIWTEKLLFGGGSGRSVARPASPFLRTFFTATKPGARPTAAQTSFQQAGLLYWRYQRSALGRRFRSWRVKKDLPPPQRPDPTPQLGSPEPALSLSQRLKALSREYGWTAVGVYFGLSLLDFPFCFLAVRLLGTDRIGHYEDVIKSAFWSMVQLAFPDAGKKSKLAISEDVAEATAREGDIGAAELAIKSGADACKTPIHCRGKILD